MYDYSHTIIYTHHISSFIFIWSLSRRSSEGKLWIAFPLTFSATCCSPHMSQVDHLSLMVSSRMVWGSCNQIKWSGVAVPRLVWKKKKRTLLNSKWKGYALSCFAAWLRSHIKQPQDKSLDLRLRGRKSSSLSSIAFSFLSAALHQSEMLNISWDISISDMVWGTCSESKCLRVGREGYVANQIC